MEGVMASVLGIQGWMNAPGGRELIEFVGRNRPTIVKILEPQTVGDEMHQALRRASPSTIIIWRFVRFFGDRNYVLGLDVDGASKAALDHYGDLRPYLVPRRGLFDIVETLNEPGFGEPLIAYETTFAMAAQRDSIWVANYAFATGTPPENAFNRLRQLSVLPNQIFAPHEYIWEGNLDRSYNYHIGRFTKWKPASARFYIGETGLEPGGWRQWGDGLFREQMPLLDRYYAAFPGCLGAVIFCWNSPGGNEWINYAIWNTGLDRWLEEYWKSNPPAHRRNLLMGAEPVAQIKRGDVVKAMVWLRLRKGPGLGHEILRVLRPGEMLLVRENAGDWLRVVALNDRTEGWCASRYTKIYVEC